MKRETFIKNAICAAFIGFILCLGAQTTSECDSSDECGRQKVDAATDRLSIRTAGDWKFTTL